MFISFYTTIYFFVKKINFSNGYISVSTLFECLYMFFGSERGHQLSTYATGGGMETHPKCVHVFSCLFFFSCFFFQCLFMFLQHFCLIVSCFICRNLTLSLFKIDAFVRNCYFSLTRSISVVSFFNLKLFFQTKVAKTLLISIK